MEKVLSQCHRFTGKWFLLSVYSLITYKMYFLMTFTFNLWTKSLVTMITWKWLFPVCTFWWSFWLNLLLQWLRLPFKLNLLLQWLHGNYFSPVCTFWWLLRLSFWLNLLLDWLHGNGFSPVCTLWCIIRLDLSEKLLSQ